MNYRNLSCVSYVALLAASSSLACGGDQDRESQADGGAQRQVTSVDVSPADIAMASLGDAVALTATARDIDGNLVEGTTASWVSSNPSVASVASTGAVTANVTAESNGTATISATVDGVSGGAATTVAQVVTVVVVDPTSHRLQTQGASVQLVATGQDARGNNVGGLSFAWSSSDTSLATVSPAGVVSAVGFGAVTITAAVDGASADSTIQLGLEIPKDGLVAAWLFNGSAIDESGNGNDGTVSGASLAPDRHGNPDSAYSFDGADDYIDIGPDVKPPFPLTVSAWVHTRELGTAGGIFRNDIWDPASFYHGIHVTVSFDEGIATGQGSGFASSTTRSQFGSAPGQLDPGNWRHVVVMYAAFNDPRFYIDNTQYPIDESGGDGASMTYSGNHGFIGNRNINFFNGFIDDVRVYSKLLTEDQIEALYFEGRLKPSP